MILLGLVAMIVLALVRLSLQLSKGLNSIYHSTEKSFGPLYGLELCFGRFLYREKKIREIFARGDKGKGRY